MLLVRAAAVRIFKDAECSTLSNSAQLEIGACGRDANDTTGIHYSPFCNNGNIQFLFYNSSNTCPGSPFLKINATEGSGCRELIVSNSTFYLNQKCDNGTVVESSALGLGFVVFTVLNLVF
jgi:hypothetical protein